MSDRDLLVSSLAIAAMIVGGGYAWGIGGAAFGAGLGFYLLTIRLAIGRK